VYFIFYIIICFLDEYFVLNIIDSLFHKRKVPFRSCRLSHDPILFLRARSIGAPDYRFTLPPFVHPSCLLVTTTVVVVAAVPIVVVVLVVVRSKEAQE